MGLPSAKLDKNVLDLYLYVGGYIEFFNTPIPLEKVEHSTLLLSLFMYLNTVKYVPNISLYRRSIDLYLQM